MQSKVSIALSDFILWQAARQIYSESLGKSVYKGENIPVKMWQKATSGPASRWWYVVQEHLDNRYKEVISQHILVQKLQFMGGGGGGQRNAK